MKSIFAAVVKYRRVIFLVFILAAVAGALLRPLVGVNYDMKDYLPEDTPSTRALRLMEKEFGGNMPNARVMIRDVTYKEARDAVSTVVATYSTVEEIRKIAAVSVLLVFLILILTTRSWLDPIIILSGIGVAVLINNGSNLIFGEISFVTNASTSILQLAVSLDYSVFLIHRFEECREHASLRVDGGGAVRPAEGNGGCGNGAGQPLHGAMVDALCKSAASIASSGLTTVIGFLVLPGLLYVFDRWCGDGR